MSVNGKKEHVNMFVTKSRTEKVMISYVSDKWKLRAKANHDISLNSAKIIAIYGQIQSSNHVNM